MLSLLELDFTTCLVFFVAFLCAWLVLQQWNNSNPSCFPLPPSPSYRLPVIGHLHIMSIDPQEKFRQWRQQCGDIFSLQLGSSTVVVISSYPLLKEAFVKFGDFFSHRPDLYILNYFAKKRGIVPSSGETWKEQRKVAQDILREMGFGKNILANKIQEEVMDFLKELEKKNSLPFDPSCLIHHSIANIICSVTWGQHYKHGDPDFTNFFTAFKDNIKDVGAETAILNFLPWLRFLPGDLFGFKGVKRNSNFIQDFLKRIYAEHVRDYDETCVKDFVSAYIREMKKKAASGDLTTLNEENLLEVIADLFGAGMETTATTISWAIVFFLHYPQVQEKCFQEIQDKIGAGRLPAVQDKTSLPYLEATIMEVLRKGNIVPFGVQHSVSEDFVFHGYYIPEGVIILPFMETVLSDEQTWKDPKVFRPERFLDETGKCLRPVEFIPFSLGRRICLGESLARMELFLFLSAMIQQFVFLPPEDGSLPSLQGILGTTLSTQPFTVRAVPRK